MYKSKSNKAAASSSGEDTIYGEYFKYTREYQEKYGENTIVLMQVGTFLEVYGVRDPQSGELVLSKIKEFASLCQFNIAEKKATYNHDPRSAAGQLMMAGFMHYLLDKYLPKMLDGGFTVVVFLQEKETSDPRAGYKRVLHKIYSPGTYLSCDTGESADQLTNNIMSIWFHLSKNILVSAGPTATPSPALKETLVCGISVINIFTGKSYMFEYQVPFVLNNSTFDELERSVSIFSPSEVIVVSPFDAPTIDKIVQFAGIRAPSFHSYRTEDNKAENCTSQHYIKQILTTFYNDDTYDVCSEFTENIVATQSYCYLLDFVREHNPDLVRKIGLPTFNNVSDRLVLANHTLLQLNIVAAPGSGDGKRSSVLAFLNNCCCPMGKRRFQHQLTNPTSDVDWLEAEYDTIEKMVSPEYYPMVDTMRKLLTHVRDMEKLCRQIVVRKMYPSSVAQLYKSVETIQRINHLFGQDEELTRYLCSDFYGNDDNDTVTEPVGDGSTADRVFGLASAPRASAATAPTQEQTEEQSAYQYINQTCTDFMSFIDKHFNIEVCKNIQSMTTFTDGSTGGNMIQSGVSDKLDAAISDYEQSQRIFYGLRQHLNGLMQKHEGTTDTEYVKVHETEKSGVSLQITSKRSLVLKKLIDTGGSGSMVEIGGATIDLKEIRFSKINATSTNVEVDSPFVSQICKKMFMFKDVVNKLIAEVFMEVLGDLETEWLEPLENLIDYVAKADMLQCKAYSAKKYNYCRPQIDTESTKSYVDTYDLRHCLIEHLQQNEIYVTNDISLGRPEQTGVLLYGTNAVGKTSLIRAIGVAVIMAQAGLFVPCSRFEYRPYTAIYSRILGNDNIFKNLSTFAVEMSELRVILKHSDQNSLILGDELCSGTETESALSIFAAGLMKLTEKQASFIFATHFHEIARYDEVKDCDSIALKHMTVQYDRENDCLVYDRKLKEGSGPRIYGLEVCKSLYLDQEFLDLAHEIRSKYFPEARGVLSNLPTTYNARKVRGTCEVCQQTLSSETHHLSPQEAASADNGYIGTFHKNHKANLAAVCEACHLKLHKNNVKIVKKKTTNGHKLMVSGDSA